MAEGEFECMGIEPRRYKTLIETIKLIPGAKPRKSKAELKSIEESTVRFKEGEMIHTSYEINGLVLKHSDFYDVFIEDDFGTVRTSPKGAKVLLKLYYTGFFEVPNSSEPKALLEYINSENRIIEEQRKAEVKEDRKRYLIEHFDELKETEFTYEILDKIFFREFGGFRGERKLRIGKIEVSKFVTAYVSNSGKSTDYEVIFSWRNENGKPKKIVKESMYSGNRRHDEKRDWGLPE